MIGFMRGRIVNREDDTVIVDVSGVGYELHCSLNTQAELSDAGDVEVWIQTIVREDAFLLFGFSTLLEKRMFNSLLKVNGVGPKMALKILSAARMDELANMIETSDVKALSNLPKVGKKTAEQLILTLKGKLAPVDLASGGAKLGKRSESAIQPRFHGPRALVLSALVNLGFRLQDAEVVVAGMSEEIEIQTGVRQGLQALSGGI